MFRFFLVSSNRVFMRLNLTPVRQKASVVKKVFVCVCDLSYKSLMQSVLRGKDNRARLSVDLTPYPEVERMLVRALQQNPGTKPTYWLVQSLRAHLAAEGYARKRDAVK